MGDEPVTNVPLDKRNRENEIITGNEAVNILSPSNNDVEFLTYPMYKCQCQVLMKKIIKPLIVRKCNLIQIQWPRFTSYPNGELFWWCKCPCQWSEWLEKLSVDMAASLGPFLSTSCLLIDLASHEPGLFFNSLLYQRMWSIIVVWYIIAEKNQ